MESKIRFVSQLAATSFKSAASLQIGDGANGLSAGTKTKTAHERFMAYALSLARKALGQTSPNPMVGAVVVKGGRIIAGGYHRRAGSAHAEVEALRLAGDKARGATLYVTLEPCNHKGLTGPCCEEIIRSGIARVVIAMRDPNPITNGRGMRRLRSLGIEVTSGVLEREARALNQPFCKAMNLGLPFVIAKMGQSLDGKIATASGQSRWITSESSRTIANQLRSQVDAVLVGINTILRDDPLLTARIKKPRFGFPIKVIVDDRLRIPQNARVLSARSSTPTLVATTIKGQSQKRSMLKHRGAEVVTFAARKGRIPLRSLFRFLVRRGIHSVLIEGGGEVFAGALSERLVDRVIFFVAPVLIGGRAAPGTVGGSGIHSLKQAIRLDDMRVSRVGKDLCVEARVVYPRTSHLTPHT